MQQLALRSLLKLFTLMLGSCSWCQLTVVDHVEFCERGVCWTIFKPIALIFDENMNTRRWMNSWTSNSCPTKPKRYLSKNFASVLVNFLFKFHIFNETNCKNCYSFFGKIFFCATPHPPRDYFPPNCNELSHSFHSAMSNNDWLLLCSGMTYSLQLDERI